MVSSSFSLLAPENSCTCKKNSFQKSCTQCYITSSCITCRNTGFLPQPLGSLQPQNEKYFIEIQLFAPHSKENQCRHLENPFQTTMLGALRTQRSKKWTDPDSVVCKTENYSLKGLWRSPPSSGNWKPHWIALDPFLSSWEDCLEQTATETALVSHLSITAGNAKGLRSVLQHTWAPSISFIAWVKTLKQWFQMWVYSD